MPWDSLGRIVRPIGGQQVMVLAAPSVGKSIFATNWAALSGARTLYMSADTDQRTMMESVSALATGHDREDLVKPRLEHSATWRRTYAEAVRDRFPNLVFDFASNPSMSDLVSRAEALTEVWGHTPELVVLDTAGDVARGGDGYQDWMRLWQNGRSFARYFNSVVMWAHHVKSGPAANGDVEPSQSDGEFKADKFSEIVLGLWRPKPGHVTATVLKNRAGRRGIRIPFESRYNAGRIQPVGL